MSTPHLLQRTDDDGIAIVMLSAPETINALSEAMLDELSDEFDRIAEDRSINAVILRSAGKHFCAGHNLKEMTARRDDADGGFQYFQDLFATCSAMMQRIVNLPQPVIAEVKGIATAAGCPAGSLEELAGKSEVHDHLMREVETRCNAKLARYQTIKKIRILSVEFSVESGEMTPTMKVKRNVISKKYADDIAGLYA